MLLAIGFVVGLIVGYPLGVASYLATYALFHKLFEDRTSRRIARVQQEAFKKGTDLANLRHKQRSIHGDMMNDSPEISEDLERVLSVGPR